MTFIVTVFAGLILQSCIHWHPFTPCMPKSKHNNMNSTIAMPNYDCRFWSQRIRSSVAYIVPASNHIEHCVDGGHCLVAFELSTINAVVLHDHHLLTFGLNTKFEFATSWKLYINFLVGGRDYCRNLMVTKKLRKLDLFIARMQRISNHNSILFHNMIN